jgi:hypothetical protein
MTTHDPIGRAGVIVAQPGALSLGDRALLARELTIAQAELRMLRSYISAYHERGWLRAESLQRAAWLRRTKAELKS